MVFSAATANQRMVFNAIIPRRQICNRDNQRIRLESPPFNDLNGQNNRITKVKINYGGNLENSAEVTLKNGVRRFQSLGKYKTKATRMTIPGIALGSRWQGTAISEIEVKEY